MSPPAPPAGLSFGLCVPLFANPGRAFFRTSPLERAYRDVGWGEVRYDGPPDREVP